MPNILLLTHRVPYPPNRGDRIRSWQILRRIARRAKVYLAAAADEPPGDASRQALNELCEKVALVPIARGARWRRGIKALATGRSISDACFYDARLAAIIDRWRAQVHFDGAVVYCSSMAQYVGSGLWQAVPCLVDLVDVDSRKWQEYSERTWGALRMIYRREARLVRDCEQQIARHADLVTVTTPAEARLLCADFPQAQPRVMNNGVEPTPRNFVNSGAVAGRVCFIGVLDYFPNVAGITWFVREIWPTVRRRVPAATLTIVGRQPVTAVRRLARAPGVTVHPDVPAVQPFLAEAELVIAPLPMARGIQNKVLEAMAMRRAVVASPAVCAGLSASPGRELLCAATSDQWQAAVVELLSDAHQRQILARAGEAFVTRQHDWERCLAPLDSWLDRVVPAAPAAVSLGGLLPQK
jgi:sugar transferase (PEP-CTERM/EpsH1 system associated)